MSPRFTFVVHVTILIVSMPTGHAANKLGHLSHDWDTMFQKVNNHHPGVSSPSIRQPRQKIKATTTPKVNNHVKNDPIS